MHSSTKKFVAQAISNEIIIKRNNHGVPIISASNRADLCSGIGYAHAWDRLVQMMSVRVIAQGRISAKFVSSDESIEVDKLWNLNYYYTIGSKGAILFESVYLNLMRIFFLHFKK